MAVAYTKTSVTGVEYIFYKIEQEAAALIIKKRQPLVKNSYILRRKKINYTFNFTVIEKFRLIYYHFFFISGQDYFCIE